MLDIANDEFPSFVDGLLGLKFRNGGGEFVPLRTFVPEPPYVDASVAVWVVPASLIAHAICSASFSASECTKHERALAVPESTYPWATYEITCYESGAGRSVGR